MTSDLEKSFKAKLRAIAKEKIRAENLAPLPEKITDVISTINNWLQLNTEIK